MDKRAGRGGPGVNFFRALVNFELGPLEVAGLMCGRNFCGVLEKIWAAE